MKKGIFALLLLMCLIFAGCGKKEEAVDESGDDVVAQEEKSAIETETAGNGSINFNALKKENEEIFAWLHIPGTDIDYPVLQSVIADDYYESHDATGSSSKAGALYIEMANITDMSDFNTVIHGHTEKNGKEGLFHQLYDYADMDFFKEHGTVYLFLDGNKLTYQVFAAFERDNTSLIRTYDFSYISGCQEFLDDVYTREMGKNILEDWEEMSPYSFIITLTTQLDSDAQKQYVVLAALVEDEAGTVDRPYME